MMIRKATSLASLDELGLTKTTSTYILKIYGTIDEAVRNGRWLASVLEEFPNRRKNTSKRKTELVSALEEAGFVRPFSDFKMTFVIADFYESIFHSSGYENVISDIGILTNEQYENFRSLSSREITEVKNSLERQLFPTEFLVLYYRFGLKDGNKWSRGRLSKYLETTECQIQGIEEGALKKLREYDAMPLVFGPMKNRAENVDRLIRELDKIYRDPIFDREDMLLRQLAETTSTPFLFSEKSRKFIERVKRRYSFLN